MEENKNQDKSQKTEKPTPHHQEKAKEKGQIAKSREVNHFFIMSVFLVVLWFLGESISKSFFRLLRPWISEIGLRPADAFHLLENLREFSLGILSVLGIFLASFVMAALGAGGIQTRFNISLEHIKPKASRISFKRGLEKQFSLPMLTEFMKGILKILLMAVVAYFVLMPSLVKVDALSGIQIVGILQETKLLVSKLLLSTVVVIAVLAAADYAYQWFETLKEMKMSHQDIRDEQKHLEGDPLSKMRQRKRRGDFVKKRINLSKAIPDATVVITNPIHYAVALKWDEKTMNAPVVIAKGSHFLALEIKSLAKENFIPIIENPPLARLLHASLEIGQEILPEHYKAIAEIIRYVMQIDQKKSLGENHKTPI